MLEDTRMFINRVIKPYNGSRCGPRADNPRAVFSFFLVTLHNVTQASVWSYILLLILQHINCHENLLVLENQQILTLTLYIQALQAMDVLFGLVGLTKTSILQSILQNLGRNTIAWFVFPVAATSIYPGITLIVWSLADIIRFSSYLNDSFGSKIPLLKSLRYNAFILLYPIGAVGEFFSVLQDIPGLKTFLYSNFGDGWLTDFLYGWLVIYPFIVFPGLLFNYGSLLRVRAKYYRELKKKVKGIQQKSLIQRN